MQAEQASHDGKLDHLLQLGMMVVFWHIIAAATVASGAGHVQNALLEDVTAALRDEGFRKVKVSVEGREVRLAGVVQGRAERQRAIAVVAMVRGTHSVDAERLELIVPPGPSPAAPTAPSEAVDQIHRTVQQSARFVSPTSSRLEADASQALGAVAELMLAHPGIRGTIEVRTTPGVAERSPGLAERRANVVRSVLLGAGVPPDRLGARGEDGTAAATAPDAIVGFVPQAALEAP